MSDFGTLTEGQLIDQRDEAIEQRDVAVERCDDARRERDAAIKKYEELARALFATGLDASGRTPLEMVARLADELRALRDPVARAQRDGSITHADLIEIRERYGALYAAVFPALLDSLRASEEGDQIERGYAATMRAQIEACK